MKYSKFYNGVIYKYPLKIEDIQTIRMPKGYEILSVQAQNDIPCLWAYVNADEKELEDVYIEIHGTGHPIENSLFTSREFIDTFQMYDGKLVFHAFVVV